jgi:hypothetical protein
VISARRFITVLSIALGSLCPAPLLGQSDSREKPAAASHPGDTLRELPPLPRAPSVELDKPDANTLEDLDEKLAKLSAPEHEARENAARELLEVEPRYVPAIAFRIRGLAERANKQAMKDLLEKMRTKARDTERARLRSAGDDSEVKTPDYLTMVAAHPITDKETYRDLIQILGMSRMLSKIGSVEAVRVLLEIYVRFGEFLRVDTQLQLERLGDQAVPALIEAQRHPAEKIVRWSKRQLDTLGRAVPSEAIQTQDHQVLADVLVAYGRIRNPDATRIIVSFANSERAVVRDGARQAIALMGEVATWQLRDSYENVVGKKPPRDWSWERTARELFREFDRSRDAAVADAFETGRAAHQKGDLDAMRRAWNELLARDPDPDRREEMAQGYLAYAEKYFDERPADVREALARARRLSEKPEKTAEIESLLLTERAQQRFNDGVADLTLVRRALELSPSNRRARALLERLSHGEPDTATQRTRWLASGALALIALAGLGVLVFRRKSPEPLPVALPETPAEPEPGTDPSKSS